MATFPDSAAESGTEALLSRPWIDPIGGYGDILMLSGVLKQLVDRDPERRFHLVTRTRFSPMLRGHPALDRIGHPPPGAELIRVDYWSDPDFGSPAVRAYATLARRLGLDPASPELLWYPNREPLPEELESRLPPRPRVLLSASSESPRKVWPLPRWVELAGLLRARSYGIAQAGVMAEPRIPGCYDLRGLTRVTEVPALVAAFDLVVTADNYLMHAAAMEDVPAVVLWGPTRHEVYGYPGHTPLQAEPDCSEAPSCLGPAKPPVYESPCPEGEGHCMGALDPASVAAAVEERLAAPPAEASASA